MTIKVSVLAICTSVLLMTAGLMMVTMPLDQPPPMEWRAHFAIANFCFGALAGIGFWQFIASRLPRT